MPGTSRNDLGTNWKSESRTGGVDQGPTGWAAWLVFAGVMLAVVALLEVLVGVTALFDEGFYWVRSDDLVVAVSYDAWGWTHLVLGLVAMVTAFLLLRGNIVGRMLAVVIAGASVLVNLAFLPAYPWWSVLAIAFNVLVIYAVTMHGSELRSAA